MRGGLGCALGQVFLNLATNALQAMPHGGTLSCTTRAKNGGVEIVFKDTGSGISDADREHLFEPFFTTRKEGTGLGLALCREILSQHDGQIEIKACEGTGVEAHVFLPSSENLA